MEDTDQMLEKILSLETKNQQLEITLDKYSKAVDRAMQTLTKMDAMLDKKQLRIDRLEKQIYGKA